MVMVKSMVKTHTLVEVVAGAHNSLAATKEAAHLVSQLRALLLLQSTCITSSSALMR